jgi:hypothetical protein
MAYVSSDDDLLTVSEAGEASLSDERQALIVAGKHTGTSMCTGVSDANPACPH